MERQDFIEGLRQLADIYESKPWLQTPSYLPTWWIFTYDAETFIQQIAAFGNGAKKYEGEDIEFIPNVILDFKITCKREKICERKVVGRRHIPEKHIPASVVAAHDEEIVEWECRPILAAPKVRVTSTEPDMIEQTLELAAGEIPF